MKNIPLTPLHPVRRRSAPPLGVVAIVLLLVVVAAVYFLSTQVREVPTSTIEVDVTNAAGR